MVQTRLAIIDLATGDQPLYEPGGAALVANAEIYNYIELRAELPDVDLRDRSRIASCRSISIAATGSTSRAHLRGMYALALARSRRRGGSCWRAIRSASSRSTTPRRAQGFAFASEPQALIAGRAWSRPSCVRQARNELLQLQFTTGRDTIFAGIRRVLPGETVVVAKGRVVERRRIDGAAAPARVAAQDEAEALAALDRVLRRQRADLHQRSDVPYGMFLSGGIDSLGGAGDDGAAQRAAGARPSPSASRAPAPPTSAPGRARVAHALGAEHVEVEFREADFWRLLPEIALRDGRSRRGLRDPADLQAGRRGARGRAQGDPLAARAATSCSPAMAAIAA